MHSTDEYLKSKLNTQQYNAACHTDWHSLILAWAWSWKTRTLTYKIANLIYEHGVDPDAILAVTFTNKAANEMKERLLSILEEMNHDLWWNMHYKPRDLKRIGTFHGIFLKILKEDISALEMKYTSNFTIYDAWDSAALLKKLLKEKDMADRLEFREAKRAISQWKNKWRFPRQAWLHCDTQMEERISIIYKHYQSALEEANALDFDDLLLLTKELFSEYPDILKKRQDKFSHILVDEAQDTNTIQFDLMQLLITENNTVTFIWDDYQSIYRWRWAMMDNFLTVDQRWPTIKTFKLEINYRSRPHIVSAWNSIIQQNNKQYDKDITPHRSGDDHIRVFTFADEVEEANHIISLITRLKEENDKQRADFTILYRTNAQSSPFEQILLAESIPYTVVWAFKFFERAEVKDMVAYIKYLLNPRDSMALLRIINTPNRRIGKTTIKQAEEAAQQQWISFAEMVNNIQEYAGVLSPSVQSKIQQFSGIMQSLISLVWMSTPWQLLEQIIQWTRYEEWLIKSDGKEKAHERMENIGQLINIAHKYDEPWRESLLTFLEEISLMTSLEETDKEALDAIKLMSVHASKWLEFPYVFIVWLEEWLFPLPKAKFDDEELEEERRWMYVALTRAEDHLFLSHAQSRQQRWQIKYNQPSRFLEELPENLVKRYDLSWWGSSRSKPSKHFEEWDYVSHKLYGSWKVLEVWWNTLIIKFSNKKFGVKKMEDKWLKKA